MKIKLLLALMLLPLSCLAQTVTLQGKVQLPDAENFNGTLTLKLSGSNIKDICTSPFKPVPTLTVNYPVTNGVLNATGGNFISQDCLTPRIPYFAQLLDNSGIVQSSDNWYLPQAVGGVVDIGNMGEENFGGPINVAIPFGIVGNPANSQVITQNSGTSFTINGVTNLNGPVNFAATPTFSTIDATQVLVGGLSTSPYPLDVQGLIDTTSGYLVNGLGGTIGQCLVSNGTAFVIGTCAPAFPTLYYQTVQGNGLVATQRNSLNFSSLFSVTDDAANNRSTVGLSTVGPGTALLTVSGALPSTNNCAQGDGMGGITLTSSPCYTQGTINDRYTSQAGCAEPSYGNLNSCGGTFIWSPAFADTNYVVDGCMANTGNNANVNISISGALTKTGFLYTQTLVMSNGAGGGWVPTITCHGHHN